MARIRKSAPWVDYYYELEAMFKEDPEVKVVYDEDNYEVKLFVDSMTKANALAELLPMEKKFGNVTMQVVIIPANKKLDGVRVSVWRAVFEGNPIVNKIETVEGIFTNPITYIVFRKDVVQYFNDDLGDYYGQCSTLYQEIAKDIFEEHEGVFFCTDKYVNAASLEIPASSYYTLCSK